MSEINEWEIRVLLLNGNWATLLKWKFFKVFSPFVLLLRCYLKSVDIEFYLILSVLSSNNRSQIYPSHSFSESHRLFFQTSFPLFDTFLFKNTWKSLITHSWVIKRVSSGCSCANEKNLQGKTNPRKWLQSIKIR